MIKERLWSYGGSCFNNLMHGKVLTLFVTIRSHMTIVSVGIAPCTIDPSKYKTRGQRPNESQKAVIIDMMKSVGEIASKIWPV